MDKYRARMEQEGDGSPGVQRNTEPGDGDGDVGEPRHPKPSALHGRTGTGRRGDPTGTKGCGEPRGWMEDAGSGKRLPR